ncbi:unnamed protein product [Plutella xylostella]|uniref:(diamondback moth) hypothetical protein n=1 Tax=Plutella xylostella TaxID=51655 RepID=A0A8S4EFI2_PLUXY|nr:unnamed protein product [Plutella xylostella]
MNWIVLFFTLGVVLADPNRNGYKSYKNFKVFDVTGNNLEALRDFRNHIETEEAHGDDKSVFVVGGRGRLQVLLHEARLETFHAALQQHNLTATLVYEDFSEVIKQEKALSGRSRNFGWKAYYDINDIYKYLRNMSKTYPEWASTVVGGRSYEGREILGLRIDTPRKRGQGKPAIFIESGIHAREWITPATTTYFINQLLTSNDPNITALRDSFDWHIFPSVNPDGYHYSYYIDRMWRKTRSRSPNGCFGADPNRNWDHNWNTAGSTSNPCDYQTYAGSKPFSEVETRTLASYIAGVENLQGYLGFHADAQMLLVPYSDSKEHCDNYDDLIQVGKTSLDYGYRVNKEKYEGPGTAAELLYPASGGSMDWVRQALGTPLVYTYELRGYYFSWPPSRIYEQGDEVTQMILGLATEAGNLGYFR